MELPTDPNDFANAITPALETSNRNPADLNGEKSYKILLAEDNVVNQKVALKFLESANHRVSVVENGALAVEAIKKNDYDLYVDLVFWLQHETID
jgi:osomolarity two-component system sensor histidine kinase NIK1